MPFSTIWKGGIKTEEKHEHAIGQAKRVEFYKTMIIPIQLHV